MLFQEKYYNIFNNSVLFSHNIFMKNLNYFDNLSLCGKIDDDISFFKTVFGKDGGFRTRKITVNGKTDCAILFMDGMSSGNSVAGDIVRSIFLHCYEPDTEITPDVLLKKTLYSGEIAKTENVKSMIRGIMYGDTVLLTDGFCEALVINTKGFRFRGVSEPPDERVSKGPREGFDEVALLNVASVRRKLLTPDFCAEVTYLGRRSDTLVFICYLESLASEKLIKLVKERIGKIDIDGILDTNYIAEKIRDNNRSIFKTSGATERPDVVAAALLEGRVAIIVDGTPVVMTVPYLFSENFQSDEDYYLNSLLGSVGRALRYISFFIAVFGPGLFITFCCHRPDLLPTPFLITVTRLRTGVPLSSIAECFALILGFELLKEAGARTFQNGGQALSIVGGLVMGQAAVEARIVSAPMLIIVAISGLCSVAVPKMRTAIFYLKIINVISASVLGLFGIMTGAVLTLFYIFSLSSFGTDCTENMCRPYFNKVKDTLFRAPWGKMILRPHFNKNKRRQGK